MPQHCCTLIAVAAPLCHRLGTGMAWGRRYRHSPAASWRPRLGCADRRRIGTGIGYVVGNGRQEEGAANERAVAARLRTTKPARSAARWRLDWSPKSGKEEFSKTFDFADGWVTTVPRTGTGAPPPTGKITASSATC
jgi:hypothetical protein